MGCSDRRGLGRWVLCVTLVLAMSVGPTACMRQQRAGRIRSLKETVDDLLLAYRWRDLRRARRILDRSLWPAYERRFLNPAQGLMISDVELELVDPEQPEVRQAEVFLVIRWHPLSSVSLRETRLKASMEFVDKEQRWVVKGQQEPGREGSGPLDLL